MAEYKEMQYYLAPMEEITTFIFRNTVAGEFGAPDRCFAPFIAPTQKILVKKRERRDISAENNAGMTLIPQILTQNEQGFCDVAGFLYDMGYREVNFNLGCPSGTVTAKGKGSGFLREPAQLNRFFDAVFEENECRFGGKMQISVKTRIGYESEDEFPAIWSVLRTYPFSEIILHPRLRTDFYKGNCRLETVAYALAHPSKAEIVYNGDIRSSADMERFSARFPEISRVMIGRGMVRNPGLIRELRSGETVKKEELQIFCDCLYRKYCELYGNEHNAIHKMKEVWTYMADCFTDAQKPLKKLLKSKTPEQYRKAVGEIFEKWH